MTFTPAWYPVVNDSAPGVGDGTQIVAAHINDIVDAVNSIVGGAGTGATTYVTDWAGAFGPGFDALDAADAGPFADPALLWGPDYFLYQTPSGEYATKQAAEGDTIACAAYLDGVFANDTTKEVIWVVTGGEWVIDTSQTVSEGTLITLRNSDDIPWIYGTLFVKDGSGRLESVKQQYERASFARTTGVRTVTGDATDDDEGGLPWGTVLVDTTAAPVTRVLPVADYTYPGREIVYINIGTNPLTVEAPAGSALNGSGEINGQYEWSAFVFAGGTQWYARRGVLDAAHVSYTPATPGDWTTVPNTVAEALDILAAAIP
jgi:hypothetical protein